MEVHQRKEIKMAQEEWPERAECDFTIHPQRQDQRFREAQAFQLELPLPSPPIRTAEISVCIGYCNNCPHCDNSDNRWKANAMKRFAIVVAIWLGLSGYAVADHTGLDVLKGMYLMGKGACQISTEKKKFLVPCELYISKDGTKHIALYADGKVQVVKKQNKDGTHENVYVRLQGTPI